ncbi:hypothetical protein, partial [Neisseria sicca]|uniref:hypothetical protein n=1 Tax=Neisseria sicca TaxID=490 RepID=UPI001C98EB11
CWFVEGFEEFDDVERVGGVEVGGGLVGNEEGGLVEEGGGLDVLGGKGVERGDEMMVVGIKDRGREGLEVEGIGFGEEAEG